jgi:hypothetical protein
MVKIRLHNPNMNVRFWENLMMMIIMALISVWVIFMSL